MNDEAHLMHNHTGNPSCVGHRLVGCKVSSQVLIRRLNETSCQASNSQKETTRRVSKEKGLTKDFKL